MTIIAAADGSALGNPGPAGWAWYIDSDTWRCGGWKRGTNNQGELTAVLDLLRQTAHVDEPLHVLCDSQYVINSITKWMNGWKRKGWKKADGKPVLNVEVMKALDEAMRGRKVTFEWVKGHAGHALNEKADALANGAAKAHASKQLPAAGPGYPGAQAVGAGEDPSAPPAAGETAPGSAPAGPSARKSNADGSRAAARTTSSPEPDLFSLDEESTPAAARSAVELVVDLERSLQTGAVRSDRARLEELLAPSWSGVGARGETLTRAGRLKAATAAGRGVDRGDDAGPMDLVESRQLGADSILLVWRETTGKAATLHSSVWVRSGDSWRQAFHQATSHQANPEA